MRLPELVDGRPVGCVFLFVSCSVDLRTRSPTIPYDTSVRRSIYPSARYGKYIRSNTLVASHVLTYKSNITCIRFRLTGQTPRYLRGVVDVRGLSDFTEERETILLILCW